MLYLNPPFPVVDGISLMPDHEDPLQWYYMPLAPRLTMVDDGSGGRAPSISVIKYRGEAGNGGFLDFDVNVGIDQDRLDAVGGQLMSDMRLSAKPRLAPVPLTDGSVRMMLFGTASEVAAATGPGAGRPAAAPQPVMVTVASPSVPGQPQFVLEIDQGTKPALYGDNQATFSVQLDQYGVTVLEQALKGVITPIGIVYSLTYLALRPAYRVRAKADWNRVQTRLSDHFGVNTLFFSADVDTVVDKLIEDRVIVIEVDTFTAPGELDDVSARRDAGVREVRDMVLNTFFKPSLDPVTKEPDTWDKLAGFVERLATPGPGGMFEYSSVDMTRIDQKTLNVDMSERTAVLRNINPQGHLGGLVDALGGGPLDTSRFTISVDIDSPWFARRKVQVFTHSDLAFEGVDSIQAELSYGGDRKTVLLDAQNMSREVAWNSHLQGGAMVRPVEVSYTLSFSSALRGRPSTLRSAPKTIEGDALQITPRELFTQIDVPVADLSFPWAHYPTVEIEARYRDEANGIDIHDTFVVRQDTANIAWRMIQIDPAKPEFEYKLQLHPTDGPPLIRDWVATDGGMIRLEDPFPSKLRFDVVAPGSLFATVDRAFVDVEYHDPANGVDQYGSFEFSADDNATKQFVVDLQDRALRRVSYRVTLAMRDGTSVVVPPAETDETRVILRPNMRGHRIVDVHTDVDFAAIELRQIAIDARYVDSDPSLNQSAAVTLASPAESGRFEYDYVDEGRRDYEYRVTYQYANGLSRNVDWTKSSTADLVLHAP